MSAIKVGDRVRTKGAFGNPDGTEFTVTRIRRDTNFGRPNSTFWVSGDPKDIGVWEECLELVRPVDAEPRRRALIAVYNYLQRSQLDAIEMRDNPVFHNETRKVFGDTAVELGLLVQHVNAELEGLQ
jgi:hypothetical protein